MKSLFLDFFRGFLLVLFFVSTLILSAWSERVFVSPDENAAYFFAEQLATTGALSAVETRNPSLDEIIHPRSMIAVGDKILPGSFLGIPTFTGGLLWLFGPAGALLFTPLLALFAVLAWRKTVLDVFKKDLLADLAAFFLMLHPAFLYYSGRVMMQNVAFVSLLIIGAYFLFYSGRRAEIFLRTCCAVFAGLLLGSALFIRTVEAPWVIGFLFVFLIVYRRDLGRRNIVAALLGLALMLGVIGGTNYLVYGSPLLTGYTAQAEAGETAASVTSIIAPSTTNYAAYLFPFGIHPRAMLRHVYDYGFLLYPWMTIPVLVGFLLLCVRRFEHKREWKMLAVLSTLLALWLATVYGSWTFSDNPNASLISIGNSYVRYWLPVFVLSTLCSAYGLSTIHDWLQRKLDGKKVIKFIPGLLLVIVVASTLVLSMRLVFTGHDGIIPTRSALTSFIWKRWTVLSKTEYNAVIVTDRTDKYLFPDRAVVTPLRDEQTYAALPALLKAAPLYYFGITFPATDLAYLNEVKLAGLGLKIELVITLDDESLYRISTK